MGTALTFILQCTTATATGYWKDSCSGGGISGISVSVVHQPSGTSVGSGFTGGDGSYSFTKKCGAGNYVITYGSSDCWKGGTVSLAATAGYQGFTPCSTDTFTVFPPLQDGLICCPGIGIFPSQLYLTDSLGTTAITMGGGCCSTGSRDHSGDKVDTLIKGRIEFSDDNPADPCFSPIACRPSYGAWFYTEWTVNSGPVACTYTLTCGKDEGGAYVELGVGYAYCADYEYDFSMGQLAYWCAWCGTPNPVLVYFPGSPPHCDDYGIELTITGHRDPDTHVCVYEGIPATGYRMAFWYFNGGCTGGPGGTGCDRYGGGGAGAGASAKSYVGYNRCAHSFGASFTLNPGPNQGDGSPYIWAFESPRTDVFAYPFIYYQPEPPGGRSVTISS